MSIRTNEEWKAVTQLVWTTVKKAKTLTSWMEGVVRFKLLSIEKGVAEVEVEKVEYQQLRYRWWGRNGESVLGEWEYQVTRRVVTAAVEIFDRINHGSESPSSDRDLLVISERVETKTQRQHPGAGLDTHPGGRTVPGGQLPLTPEEEGERIASSYEHQFMGELVRFGLVVEGMAVKVIDLTHDRVTLKVDYRSDSVMSRGNQKNSTHRVEIPLPVGEDDYLLGH